MPSNVTSLPTDTLMEIFEWAVLNLKASDIGSLNEAPLNISHTCRSWRALVLSVGRWWARFGPYHASNAPLAKLWIERVVGTLLGTCIEMPENKSSMEDVKELAEAIIAKRMGWRYMNFVSGSDASNMFRVDAEENVREPLMLHDLPFLQKLTLLAPFPFGVIGRKSSQRALFSLHAPLLTMRPIAPVLTELICEHIDERHEVQLGILTMLCNCPSLKTLKLLFDRSPNLQFSDDTDMRMFECTLKRLTTLALSFYVYPYTFLRQLRVPNLYGLRISAFKRRGISVMGLFLPSFLSDVGPSVRNFRLRTKTKNCEAIGYVKLQQLYRALPGITDLDLDLDVFDSSLLVLGEDEHGLLCPDLLRFRIVLPRDSGIRETIGFLDARIRFNRGFRAQLITMSWTEEKKMDLEREVAERCWNADSRVSLNHILYDA